MKLHLLLVLLFSTAACLRAARPFPFPEGDGDRVIPNGFWRCPRHIVFTTLPTDPLGGMRLRTAFIAITRPRFPGLIPFSTLFEPTAEEVISSDDPSNVLLEEIDPPHEEGSEETSQLRHTSEIERRLIDLLSEGNSEVRIPHANAEGKNQGSSSLTKTASEELGHGMKFRSNLKPGTHEVVNMDSLPLKPLFPIKGHSNPSNLRFTGLNGWPFTRKMQLRGLDQSHSSDELGGDGTTSSNPFPNALIRRNKDGSTSYHKFVDVPNGFYSIDIYSSKPFLSVSESSQSYERRERATIIQSFMESVDSFYGSIYGVTIVGILCSLILSMMAFLIMGIFFPVESDDDATAFIVSTSQSPTTPLLDDAIGSDSESLASEGEAPKYQPPSAEN